MKNCPTCGAVVSLSDDGHYIHVQPPPLDLNLVKLRAMEDLVRTVEARVRAKPGLSVSRVLREELNEARRMLSPDPVDHLA